MKWVLLLLVLCCACSRSEAAPEKRRIVSVGGAVTETVFALGVGADVVAVDTSSVYPEEATKLPKVGYQRTLSAEGILALRPSVVLATGEAGPPEVIAQLRTAGIRVEIFPAEPTVKSARARMAQIGDAVGRDSKALIETLDRDVAKAQAVKREKRPKVVVVYARGGSGLHVFGRHTSGDTMATLVGADNVAGEFEGTKPLGPESLVASAPDAIVIPTRGLESLGGLEALLKVPGVMETPAGKNRRIIAIDDAELLGFGPRTGAAAIELSEKLGP